MLIKSETQLETTQKALLIDADDTLWENNIYFEQVIHTFLELMQDLGCAPSVVQKVLNEVERKNVRLYGYGVENFVRSLKETLLKLRRDLADRHFYLKSIEDVSEIIMHHPIELLDGVEASLEHLSRHYLTVLFTKGSPAEQRRKIDASGLARFFHAIEIVREKNRETFEDLISKHQLRKESTWMIGNSPKSDINPAVEVGINAIYIPHPRTWELEKEVLAGSERVIILNSFSELLRHF